MEYSHVWHVILMTCFIHNLANSSLKDHNILKKNLKLPAAGLFKYVWLFSGHHALKGQSI